jgi:hypothetical protein
MLPSVNADRVWKTCGRSVDDLWNGCRVRTIFVLESNDRREAHHASAASSPVSLA